MVQKTDGEICFNLHRWINYYIHLFSALSQKRSLCWKCRKWGCHLKNRYLKNISAKMVKNARLNFSFSPYRTLWFSRKGNLKFFEVALVIVLWNDVVGSIINMWGDLHWSTANTIPFTCFLWNGHKNTQTRYKVCSNLSNVLQQLTFVLVVNFINLEHLSCPTLVLLFKLWKGKCWLEVCSELFVKNNTAMLICTHSYICSSLINTKIVLWSCHTNFNEKIIGIENVFS